MLSLSFNDTALDVISISARIDNVTLESVVDFVGAQQIENGGFHGRSSEADIYYTFFAMSIMAAIGGVVNMESLAGYLESFGDGRELDFVHLACLIRCRAIMGDVESEVVKRQLKLIEEYRAGDGGYQQSGKGAIRSSVYACFIAWLVYRDVKRDMPDQDGVMSCMETFRLADGGYVNDLSVRSGSTTATAAAMVLLCEFGLLVGDDTVTRLLSRMVVEGGFLACETTPMPDLLSTATALYALRRVGYDMGDGMDVHHDYVASLWNEDGGFAGNALDGVSDCEYTYYALLAF